MRALTVIDPPEDVKKYRAAEAEVIPIVKEIERAWEITGHTGSAMIELFGNLNRLLVRMERR